MSVQGSPEWFAARAAVSVTGSMIGMICDLSPYGGFDDAMRQKVREVLGLPPDRPATEAMRRGTEMEPVARSAYEVETGNLVEEVGLIIHPDIPWIGSSPDGRISDPLEIKVRNTPRPIETRRYEWAQTQAHMQVTGADQCHYWQFDPDTGKGVLEVVERDQQWWESALPRLRYFHEKLQTILADEALQAPYREPLVERRTDAEFLQAEHEYVELKLALEAATSAEKKAKARLLKLAGDKRCEGELVKVTTYEKQGLIDNKALHEACRAANIDPESYRGKPSTATRITVK